jgi:hypothetical protein
VAAFMIVENLKTGKDFIVNQNYAVFVRNPIENWRTNITGTTPWN